MKHAVGITLLALLAGAAFAYQGVGPAWQVYNPIPYNQPRSMIWHPQLEDFVVTDGHRIYRLTEEGTVGNVWTYQNQVQGMSLNELAPADGGVFAGGVHFGDGYLAKYGPGAVMLWEHVFDADNNTQEPISHVVTMPGGDVVALHSVPGSNVLDMLYRFTDNGELVWAQPARYKQVYDIAPLNDGGVAYVSERYQGDNVNVVKVARHAADGTFVWSHTIQTHTTQFDPAVAQFSDGTILVMNRAEEPMYVQYMVRSGLDPDDGTVLWSEDDVYVNHRVSDITRHPNGNLMAAGGHDEGWVMEIAPNGEVVRVMRDYYTLVTTDGPQFTCSATSPDGVTAVGASTLGSVLYFTAISDNSPVDPFESDIISRYPLTPGGFTLIPEWGAPILTLWELINLGDVVTMDFWVDITHTASGATVTTQIEEDYLIEEGRQIFDVEQEIPETAPDGKYTIIMHIGQYPDQAVEARGFEFFKNVQGLETDPGNPGEDLPTSGWKASVTRSREPITP